MTEKELKKLNRQELLEVLLAQSKKIDRLQTQLKETRDKLTEREIVIAEAGSIAEASLRLNKVFLDAQKAADQYLDNIRRLHEQAERKYNEGWESAPDDRKESGSGLTFEVQEEEKSSAVKEMEQSAGERERMERECAAMKEQILREKERMERECAEMKEQILRDRERSEKECDEMKEQAQTQCAEMKSRTDKQIRHSLVRTKKAVRHMLGLYADEVEKRMKRLQRWDRQMEAMHEREIEKQSS